MIKIRAPTGIFFQKQILGPPERAFSGENALSGLPKALFLEKMHCQGFRKGFFWKKCTVGASEKAFSGENALSGKKDSVFRI